MGAYRNGVLVPTTIFECAALHYSVKVHCSRCTNATVFEPAGLWWHFYKKGWSDRLQDAGAHLYCHACAIGGIARQRPLMLEVVNDRPERTLPPPPDREWKRATSRFRA